MHIPQTFFSPASNYITAKKVLPSQKWRNSQVHSRKSRCRVTEGLHSLRPQIFTGKWKETVLITRFVQCYHLQGELYATG